MSDDPVIKFVDSAVKCIGSLVDRVGRDEDKLRIALSAMDKAIILINNGGSSGRAKEFLEKAIKEIENYGKDKKTN